MSNTYDMGDLVRLDVEITISGSYVDPAHIALWIKNPDGITSDYFYGVDAAFIKDTVGKYHYDYFAADYGQHVYKFQASGTAWGVEEKTFVVRIPQV